MNSSLQGPYACPGESIKFVCITRNSSTLVWKSKEYLGNGELITFILLDWQGTRYESLNNPDSSAILDSISTVNGSIDITSTFSIVVSSDLSDIQMVTCINVDIGTRKTINFMVAGPGMSMYVYCRGCYRNCSQSSI